MSETIEMRDRILRQQLRKTFEEKTKLIEPRRTRKKEKFMVEKNFLFNIKTVDTE